MELGITFDELNFTLDRQHDYGHCKCRSRANQSLHLDGRSHEEGISREIKKHEKANPHS